MIQTYNHESFIAQSVESVLMQRANFAYEIVIVEDCSTDGTRDIVVGFQQMYPDKIRLILSEENKGDNTDFATAFQSSASEYVAWLDGDDYWTSPHKLQKQVDFLDSHPECALCFHNVAVFYEDGSREPWNRNPVNQKEISTLEDLWAGNFIAGCSPMFRRELIGEIPDWYRTDISGDWSLYLLSAERGKIGYIDEVMGAYRVHSEGVWSKLSETQRLEEVIEFYEAMNSNLGFKYDDIIKRMISKCHVQLAVERSGLPKGVTVIVVDRSEDPLLYWEGRQPWYFPQDEKSAYADHYPTDSAEAIARLEELRARGADYLFFPGTTAWWLDHYNGLRQHLDTWHRRVWENKCGVIYKLLDMPIVEITEVSLADRDPRLIGRHVDAPKAGTVIEASALDLAGWVLGKSSPAVAVEVVSEGAVVRRLPLNHRRPDIAEAFPGVPGAEDSGFKASISALGTAAEFELGLQAVLQDQSRVPLGAIRGRRLWAQGEEERQTGMALVSVVIPCYNQARFLGEAIESVLSQSYPHLEVVVVDDGSTDNTSEVASRYSGVRCVRQENRGLAGARNAGIRRSRGSYLVFLDSDDRLLPGALEAGLKHLKERPECAFVSGHWKLIGFDGAPLETPPQTPIEGDHYEALLRGCYISTPAAVMYQRVMLEYMGGFDTSVSSSADYDLYLRVARQYPMHHHGEVVAEYRRHGSNMTLNPARMLKSEVTVLRRQRKYVSDSKQYTKAYEVGIKHSREWFGEPLVVKVRDHARKREWKQTLQGMLMLLRYHPRGFISALRV